MEKINKLSLPTTILIVSIIIGSFYFVSQIINQNTVEKQQQVELQAQQAQAEQDKVQQDTINQTQAAQAIQAQSDAAVKQKMLDDCMTEANTTFVNVTNADCLAEGYTQSDIDNLRCFISTNALKNYQDAKTQAQDMCLNLYK